MFIPLWALIALIVVVVGITIRIDRFYLRPKFPIDKLLSPKVPSKTEKDSDGDEDDWGDSEGNG